MTDLGSIYGTTVDGSNTLVIDFSNVQINGTLKSQNAYCRFYLNFTPPSPNTNYEPSNGTDNSLQLEEDSNLGSYGVYLQYGYLIKVSNPGIYKIDIYIELQAQQNSLTGAYLKLKNQDDTEIAQSSKSRTSGYLNDVEPMILSHIHSFGSGEGFYITIHPTGSGWRLIPSAIEINRKKCVSIIVTQIN